MRGSPVLHVLLFLLAFAMLALPLSHLTFARPAAGLEAVDAPETPAGREVPVVIRVRLAHLPVSLSLKLDNQEELLPPAEKKPARGVIEFERTITIPAEGIEIFTTATWPDGTPDTAVTIELEPRADLASRSVTQWTEGGTELSVPFTFSW